jgi:trehalose 6-phosphate phosphatase
VNYLFEAEGRRELGAFLGPGTLVALDYDGTLAPIVARPEQAHMPAATRSLLARVARRFPVVILSGRARNDAMRFLEGVAVIEVIGSHGLETAGGAAARFVGRVGRWRERLAERLRPLRGVAIEDKRYSLAVHYRHAADPAASQAEIESAAAGLEGARLLGGKAVLNLVPSEAPHKGAALLAACQRLGCPRAVFVGDDETDEDVFTLGRPQQVFTVRIGEHQASAARYFLRDQAEIDRLLETLLGRPPRAG